MTVTADRRGLGYGREGGPRGGFGDYDRDRRLEQTRAGLWPCRDGEEDNTSRVMNRRRDFGETCWSSRDMSQERLQATASALLLSRRRWPRRAVALAAGRRGWHRE